MPGLVAFGRRWSVGSDDLFLPSIFLCSVHTLWLITVIVALTVNFEDIQKSNAEDCADHMLEILLSVIVLLFMAMVLELSLTIISLRGSIIDDGPRTPAQYLIYIRLITLLTEVIWSGFGVAWMKEFYFDCSLSITKQVILGLVICTWFVFFSLLITAWCTYDVAGRSWVKMKRYQANLKEMELKHPAYRRSGSRHRNWRQRKVMRAYQNSWNHRCKLLFCCIHSSEQNRDSFTDLARILSEFFRDLDVVPSDVIVGLLLLRRLQRLEQCSIVKQKRNNTYEFLSGIAITPKTKFVAMNDPKDLDVFHNVVYFMHYASAAYGWPWYVIPNGLSGVWKLCSNLKCCCHYRGCRGRPNDLAPDVVVEDNCCYCNYAVIPTMFVSGAFDVIYATYHVDVGETAFFVIVDYDKEAIVISIRGTLSLKDVITDLNAEGEPLPLQPPREDWIGHKGMVQAAVYMKTKLIGDQILEKAFNRSPDRKTETYRLVIVGHSLGAGTAVILAVLLRETYPNLRCYAYSPPGGLLSMPVVEYTKEFVTSVIVGKDVVPRIGLSQMEALRADLINAIKKSHKPKWQTIMSGIACCCCIQPEFGMPQRLSSAPSIQSEEFLRTRRSLRDLREVTINPNESAISLTVHQPLYPPGRIMHIVRHHPKKDERVMKKGEPVFQALWTENTDYGQVLISPGMIQDHMPDQVLQALHRVVNSHGPAKPQRVLAASTSPLVLSRESLVYEERGREATASPQKLCIETSFTNTPNAPKYSPECTLMNPSPLIIDADADIEDGDLTPTNPNLNDILQSLNLSWDYVTNLQEMYLEKESLIRQHERNGSLGNTSSSGCSEAGSTFKEIFGHIKYEEWMAPLASPETLSEISSLSSRASFLIPKDQSPMMRLKGRGALNSASLHRHKNGSLNGNGSLANNCHNRSYSCTYPENSEVATISSAFCVSSTLSHSHKVLPMNANGNGDDRIQGSGDSKTYFEVGEPDFMESIYADLKESGIMLIPETTTVQVVDEQQKKNGEAKRVSFNLKKKYASKDSGCSDGEMSSQNTPTPTAQRYEPIYPIFSHQEEYGVPPLNSPHYTYCGQSPQESPNNLQSPLSNNKFTTLTFPDPHSSIGIPIIQISDIPTGDNHKEEDDSSQ